MINYVKEHRVSLGLLLAAYGAFYLAAVIMGGWTLADWGVDIFDVPPSAVHALVPRSLISPIFFVTSVPALIIGTVMLCVYSIRGLNPMIAAKDGEHVALLLTAAGFAYIIVGAWPLMDAVDLPWEWQKQIMSYGAPFAWALYILSLVVFAVGAVSMYVHSRAYHRRHPELSIAP